MNKNSRFAVQAGVIAAVYTALTLLLQPLSYGMVQLRAAEVLTVLPVYFPAAIPGLTVGCFLSNLMGLASNPAGAWDLLCGTATTALAAVLSYALRRYRVAGLPLLSTLPPVILNALVVGGELALLYGNAPWGVFAAWVALGQLGACTLGGLLLAYTLEKTGLSRDL